MNHIVVFLLVALSLSVSLAWSPQRHKTALPKKAIIACETTTPNRALATGLLATTSRRGFLASTCAAISTGLLTNSPASAAVEGNVFANKNFSVDDAKKRLQAAQKDLKDLVKNYSDISKSGGDAVRNALGTQGVNSNLYGIQKILKILREEAEDFVEYTEAMDEFNAYYYQAEGAAYQSLFVEHSSAKGTPESFLKTAKADIIQCDKLLDKVAAQLPN